jgi:histone acetyltransferase (RNA polymerase elongator complex component)
MRHHEWSPKDDKDRLWCVHCGCLFHPQLTATCIERPDPPRERRIERAMNDLETIRKRIEQLRKEREDNAKIE